jgi:lipopolysaccharide biosynthesis regulator YciM
MEAYLLLGNTIRSDFPEQAVKIHQSLTVRPGLSKSVLVDIHKELAEDYRALKKIDRAKREGENILRYERRNKWALELMLALAEEEKDWQKAEHWNRLLLKIYGKDITPDLGRYHVYTGMDKMEFGDLSPAVSEFKKAIKISTESALPYLYLGKIYDTEGKKEDALEYWKEYVLLTANPELDIYKAIERLLFELNRYSEVEEIYRCIVEKYPENVEALVRMVNHMLEKGNVGKAISLLDRYQVDSMTVRLLKYKVKLPNEIASDIISGVDSLIKESLKTAS